MTTADEILAGAVEATSEGATQDKVLRIDNELRTISIPSTVKLLGVESDEDVNVIKFEMPRHYEEVDLSTFSVRVNYMNANGDGDIYKVTDLVADEEKMTFSWLVGRTASMYKGDTRFVVCLKKLAEDSVKKQEYNTTVASLPVLQGLEPNEQLVQRYPDIIEQMLKFMEAPISPEEVGKAVEEYLKKNPIGGATINDEEVSAGSVWSSQKTSTQIDEKVSAHNIDPNAHTDVRELISGLTNRLNALADSDDTTLDQLSEIVAYIKSNKTLIDAITTSKVSVSDIVDDLITNSSNKPLSAAQGVKLKALIDAIVPITVDSVLSSTSTNPVQNRVVLNGLNEKENKGAARGVQIGSNSYTPNESGMIDLSGALSDTNAVLYTAQTLDDAQKAQARENIGAADEALQNVLVGSETGNPIAVDDAFASPLRGLTVYGKSTQDGTPTPDAPVPIVSAGEGGNVTVKVTGRNILDLRASKESVTYSGVTYTRNADYSFTRTGTATDTTGNVWMVGGYLVKPKADLSNVFCVLLKGVKYSIKDCILFTISLSGVSLTAQGPNFVPKEDMYITGVRNEVFVMDKTYNDIVYPAVYVGEKTLQYEPYREQLLTLPTPNGLPGIPVTSGGNYTDQSGQQWICDEIDLKRRVKVQRVNRLKLDGLSWTYQSTATNKNDAFSSSIPASQAGITRGYSLCQYAVFDGIAYDIEMKESCRCYVWNKSVAIQFKAGSGINSVDAFSEWLKTRPDASISYCLATPIETPLTPAEIAAYKALTIYAPDTVVQASDGAGVKLEYQRDVNIATNWKPTVNQLNTDVGQLKSDVNQLKSNVNAKINQSDALTLEEILASTNLTNKVASAEAVKAIKNDVYTLKQGNFYTEQNKGNTMPAAYGGFVRISGQSWPGSFVGDTYYLGVDADSTAYSGAQINGAKQVTWKTL